MKKLVISVTLMFAMSAFSEGGNVGSSGKTTAYLQYWCTTVIGDLDHLRRQEDKRWMFKNNPALTAANLEQGIRDAIEKMKDVNAEYSLLKRALERGINILDALRRDPSVIDDRVIVRFLRNYYVMLVDGVGPIDSSLHIELQNNTYREGGKRVCRIRSGPESRPHIEACPENRLREWEEQYTRFAGMQIKWLLATHTGVGYFPDGGGKTTQSVISFGPAKAYTIPAELVAGFVATDLEDSLWSDYYKCTISVLGHLAEDLANFNAGTAEFDTQPTILQDSSDVFKEVESKISRRCPSAPGMPGNPR